MHDDLRRKMMGLLMAGIGAWMLVLPASQSDAASGAEIDAGVNTALKTLYAVEPAAKDLAAKSIAVLVFPEIVKGGLIVGGQYGEGALRIGGKTKRYYSIAGASYGLQIGGQKFSYAMFFLTKADRKSVV